MLVGGLVGWLVGRSVCCDGSSVVGLWVLVFIFFLFLCLAIVSAKILRTDPV